MTAPNPARPAARRAPAPLDRAPYDLASALADAAVLGLAAAYGGALALGYGPLAAAAVAVAVAAVLALATGRNPRGLARTVAAAAPLGPGLLALASMRTQVTVVEAGAVAAYPWFPAWLAAGLAMLGWASVLRLGPERAARPVVMLWTGLPLLWLLTAELPGAIGPVGLQEDGALLVGALALLDGRLPWADLHMPDGPWLDAGRALVGMLVLDPSRWGAVAGLQLILKPLHLAGLAGLFAWLSGWRWPHAALATLLVIRLDPSVHVGLILWAPQLAALALLLARPTAARAVAVVAIGALHAVLVPDAALAAIAVAATIVLHDAIAGPATGGQRFRRTVTCSLAAAGAIVVVAAALVATGTWPGFAQHLADLARGPSLAAVIAWARDQPIADLRIPAGLVVAALVLVAAGAGWAAASRRRPDVRDWVVVAAALFALLCLPKVVQGADAARLYAPAAAVLVGAVAIRLAALLEAALPGPRLVPHPVVAAAVLAVAVAGPPRLADGEAGLPAVRAVGPVLDPDAIALRLRPTVITSGAYPVLGYASADAVDAAIVDGWRLLLDGWVTPGRPILDLTNRPALFHVLLGYRPAGRFLRVDLAAGRDSQQAMVADLDRLRPDAVIMPTRRGRDGVPGIVRHHIVSRAVLERYVPAEAFADGVLYVPRGTELTHPSLYRSGVACDWGDAGDVQALGPAAVPATEWPSSPVAGPETVAFRGWAAAAGAPADRVVATLGGRPIADQIPDRDRPDVAAALGAPGAAASGFQMTVQVPRGTGRRIRLLAEYPGGEMLALDAGPAITFDSAEPAPGASGGVLDSRDIAVHEGVRHLARLPVDDRSRGGIRLIVNGGIPGRRYLLADRPPWALRDPGNVISFASASGGRSALPVGACPQWWGYGGRPLYLWSADGKPVDGIEIGWELAP